MVDTTWIGTGNVNMPIFSLEEASAPAWTTYKRDFMICLEAAGLDQVPGRRKVGNLKCMGRDAVCIHDKFQWAPATVAHDRVPARPAEDKYNLESFIKKPIHKTPQGC